MVGARGKQPATLLRALPLVFAAAALILAQVNPAAAAQTPSAATTVSWTAPYQIVQHRLPSPGSDPWAITVDPGGTVWFVEQGTNRLGGYDPSTGRFTEFAIPTPGAEPVSVASDSSGNIWFGELAANKLGELPHGGSTISEFQIPGSSALLSGTKEPLSCGPTSLLADPSGALWIACPFSNQIDIFHPGNHTFSSFNLPVFQSAPAGMALDGRGNLWFTAADAQMLGKAAIGSLRNGTTDGISEFAPLNDSYVYRFSHTSSFLGGTTTITSSLPTPSGIAIGPDGRLWVTEHVDSSFDSYDVTTGALDRYWTSQTMGAYGYAVSFPNGVAVDRNGTVWIGEHYGNKIAEFDPTTRQLTEYPVPCCGASAAGVYSVTLDPRGNLWFVEIQGNAIGELVPSERPAGLSLTLPGTHFVTDPHGTVAIPLTFDLPGGAGVQALSLNLSGISGTGVPQNLTARFAPASLTAGGPPGSGSVLSLTLTGLRPGSYYLTLTASASPQGVLFSAVIGLTVVGQETIPVTYVAAAAVALSLVAAFIAWMASRSSSRRRTGKRVSGRPPGRSV